jgi:hypothetical protein
MAETPTWTETRPGVFDLRLNERSTFLVTQTGSRYEILLPGYGRVKCWNRAQVEKMARSHLECQPDEEPEDDADGIPSPKSLLRHYHGQVL